MDNKISHTITLNGQERAANLFLHEISPNIYEIVMPNEYGELQKQLPSKNGVLMAWPLNPHFTGQSGIISLLRQTEQFSGAKFKTKYGIE